MHRLRTKYTTTDKTEALDYGEEDTFFKMQVSVTYTHTDTWQGLIPPKSRKLHRFLDKAASGQPVTVLFYGDSITTGCNSSQMVNVPPYAQCWYEMIIDTMKKHFGNPNIRYFNTAVGAKNTSISMLCQ